jgi:hypothetical protein
MCSLDIFGGPARGSSGFIVAKGGGASQFEAVAHQAAEKVIYCVIPNEVRNLSLVLSQEKRDSSARSAPRKDKHLSFSETSFATKNARKMKWVGSVFRQMRSGN